MSQYTMTIKEIIDNYTDGMASNLRDQIEKGRQMLFDFDYPIFDVAYKKIFETHFIRTFYMREIGFETDGYFKFQLETWLNINMPYFNKLFESELIVFDPLKNTDMEVSQNRTGNSQQNSVGNSTSKGSRNDTHFNRDLETDTPQSRLQITTNSDGTGVIEYASKIEEQKGNDSSNAENSSSSDVTNNINNVEDYIEYRKGKTGSQSFSKMLTEYRESLIRIENKLFDEMQELFMLVYS